MLYNYLTASKSFFNITKLSVEKKKLISLSISQIQLKSQPEQCGNLKIY